LLVRSIVAQAYLELVRAWVVNTTDRWLFAHVSSAGTNVQTHFSTSVAKVPAWKMPCEKVEEEWIAQLSGDRSYFWSEDNPREKETLLKHMRQWKRDGLHRAYFDYYSHILCFDSATFEILTKMKALAAQVSSGRGQRSPSPGEGPKDSVVDPKIFLLGPVKSFNVPVAETIEWVKTHIKRFLAAEFDWVRPPKGIADGPKRTLFLWMPPLRAERIYGKNGRRLKYLEETDQCRIYIPRYSRDEEKRGKMVSIVGRNEILDKVESSIQLLVDTNLGVLIP
jgi:KH domain